MEQHGGPSRILPCNFLQAPVIFSRPFFDKKYFQNIFLCILHLSVSCVLVPLLSTHPLPGGEATLKITVEFNAFTVGVFQNFLYTRFLHFHERHMCASSNSSTNTTTTTTTSSSVIIRPIRYLSVSSLQSVLAVRGW